MKNRFRYLFIRLLCVSDASVFGEQAATKSGKPITTSDPHIPVEQLKLRPLTRAGVKV